MNLPGLLETWSEVDDVNAALCLLNGPCMCWREMCGGGIPCGRYLLRRRSWCNYGKCSSLSASPSNSYLLGVYVITSYDSEGVCRHPQQVS